MLVLVQVEEHGNDYYYMEEIIRKEISKVEGRKERRRNDDRKRSIGEGLRLS